MAPTKGIPVTGNNGFDEHRNRILADLSRHEQAIGALNERTNVQESRITRMETTIKVWAAVAGLIGAMTGSVIGALLLRVL